MFVCNWALGKQFYDNIQGKNHKFISAPIIIVYYDDAIYNFWRKSNLSDMYADVRCFLTSIKLVSSIKFFSPYKNYIIVHLHSSLKKS